jgi:hypothetical protein
MQHIGHCTVVPDHSYYHHSVSYIYRPHADNACRCACDGPIIARLFCCVTGTKGPQIVSTKQTMLWKAATCSSFPQLTYKHTEPHTARDVALEYIQVVALSSGQQQPSSCRQSHCRHLTQAEANRNVTTTKSYSMVQTHTGGRTHNSHKVTQPRCKYASWPLLLPADRNEVLTHPPPPHRTRPPPLLMHPGTAGTRTPGRSCSTQPQ